MKKLLLIAFVALCTTTTFAQTTKVGTVDTDLILTKMPELTTVQDALKEYSKDLENDLQDKLVNYDSVLKAAQAAFEEMSPTLRTAKQEELAGLEREITNFRNNANQLVQLKQEELLRPLYDIINDNIAIIAKELQYTQILNTGNNNNLAYIDSAHDITAKTLAKMGIVVE